MGKILLALACAFISIECGRANGRDETAGQQLPILDSLNDSKYETNIIGGGVSVQGDHPHQLAIFIIYSGSLIFNCGGSLISPKWAITAAKSVSKFNASSTKVRAGEQNLDISSGYEQEVYVKAITLHPDFDTNPESKDYSNDIAILELAEEFKLTESVQPIALPQEGEVITPGTSCIVSGWGSIDSKGINSRNLSAVTVPYVARDACKERYNVLPDYPKVTDTTICAGGKGKAFCGSDEGGPLLCSGTNQKNGTLTGIASFGFMCGFDGMPGVYTEVSKFRKFIKEVTGL